MQRRVGLSWPLAAVVAGAFVLGAILAVPPAQAQDGTGETVTNACMDDVFPGNLNCNANDVQIAQALNPVITDPCDYPGDSVTFSADFEVVLTAQERYDIGLYFKRMQALTCELGDEAYHVERFASLPSFSAR